MIPETSKDYVLYRFYGEDDALLYVGQSIAVWDRFKAHATSSRFYPEAVCVRLERGFTSAEELDVAEIAAIKSERPKYNVIHNNDNPARVAPVRDRSMRSLQHGIFPRISTAFRTGDRVALQRALDDIRTLHERESDPDALLAAIADLRWYREVLVAWKSTGYIDDPWPMLPTSSSRDRSYHDVVDLAVRYAACLEISGDMVESLIGFLSAAPTISDEDRQSMQEDLTFWQSVYQRRLSLSDNAAQRISCTIA